VEVPKSKNRVVCRVVRPVCRHESSWRSTASTLDVSIPHLLFWMALTQFF
jgi:hypothetical protein